MNFWAYLKKEGLAGISFFSDTELQVDKEKSEKIRKTLARTFVYIKERERSGEIIPY